MQNLSNNKRLRDIWATLKNTGWRLISGPLLMLFIPLFLTGEEQGYWYLFGSISALSVLADLGFSNIVLLFTAHESLSLQTNADETLLGDAGQVKKVASLFRYIVNWIMKVALVAFPLIHIVGMLFFQRDGVLAVYLIPWTIYSVGSLINFVSGAILSFIEGLDRINEVQTIRFRVAVINSLLVMVMLYFGCNIYALAVGMLASSSFTFISFFGRFRKLILQLWSYPKTKEYNWSKEVLPLFSKYVVSSITVYLTLYIYTPVMQLFRGPVYSGQVGLTFTLVNAIYSISNVWITSVTPRFSMLVEEKNWKQLDDLFNKRLKLSVATYAFFWCAMTFVLALPIFREIPLFSKVFDRLLPLEGISLLTGAYFLNVFINAWGVYAAAHKQLPFLMVSIYSTVLVVILTVLLASFAEPRWYFAGTFLTYVISGIVTYFIFKKCRRQWHE